MAHCVARQTAAAKRGVTAEELAGEVLAEYVPDSKSLAYADGVIPMLTHAFGDNPAIDEVFIFGSWAARYHGEPGPSPNDVDVAVVSESLTHFDLAEARLDLENESKLSINLFVFEADHERLTELRARGVPVAQRVSSHR